MRSHNLKRLTPSQAHPASLGQSQDSNPGGLASLHQTGKWPAGDRCSGPAARWEKVNTGRQSNDKEGPERIGTEAKWDPLNLVTEETVESRYGEESLHELLVFSLRQHGNDMPMAMTIKDLRGRGRWSGRRTMF